MLEEAEHLELAKDPFRGNERLEHVGHLLESDAFAIARICHRPVKNINNSITYFLFFNRFTHTGGKPLNDLEKHVFLLLPPPILDLFYDLSSRRRRKREKTISITTKEGPRCRA